MTAQIEQQSWMRELGIQERKEGNLYSLEKDGIVIAEKITALTSYQIIRGLYRFFKPESVKIENKTLYFILNKESDNFIFFNKEDKIKEDSLKENEESFQLETRDWWIIENPYSDEGFYSILELIDKEWIEDYFKDLNEGFKSYNNFNPKTDFIDWLRDQEILLQVTEGPEEDDNFYVLLIQ